MHEVKKATASFASNLFSIAEVRSVPEPNAYPLIILLCYSQRSRTFEEGWQLVESLLSIFNITFSLRTYPFTVLTLVTFNPQHET